MSPEKRSLARILRLAIPSAAILFLLTGSLVSRKVYDPSEDAVGLLTFHRISERQLVADATFSGVIRKGSRLFSTYDRSSAQGKRACPT